MSIDIIKANIAIFEALQTKERVVIAEVTLPASPPYRLPIGRMLQGIAWVILAGIAGAVLLAYAVPFEPWNTHSDYRAVAGVAFMVRVFQFHLGIAALGVGAVAALARWRRLGVAGGLVGVALLSPTLQAFWPKTPPPSQGPSVRVMTMNLLYLNRDTDAILRRIRENNPNIIAMQEYSTEIDPTMRAALGDYPYRFTAPIANTSQGMAVYSRVPIKAELETPRNVLGVSRRIRAEFEWGGKTIVLYDVHPTCPAGLPQIARNQMQAADLIGQLSREKNPVIVAGDFNATETTASAAALERFGLSDSHSVAGFGHAATWPNLPWLRFLPGFEIDHVYFGKGLVCKRCWVAGGTGSDHWPVVADLGVRDQDEGVTR